MASAGLQEACRSPVVWRRTKMQGDELPQPRMSASDAPHCHGGGEPADSDAAPMVRPPNAIELLIVPSDVRSENIPSIRFSTKPGEEPTVELGLE